MRWGGQVRAVLRKDLRQVWVFSALLLGVMLLTILQEKASQSDLHTSFMWFNTVIPVLILGIMSAVVRADPPAVSNAFWSTQPLQPSAVATAKLLHAVLIGVLTMSGAAAMMRSWGPGSADVSGTVVLTGISAATFSLAAAFFATMSSDARGALLGAALTLAAFFALDRFWPSLLSRPGSVWWRVAYLAVLAADVTALVRLYRRREVAQQWRVGSGVLVAATVLCALAASRAALDGNMPRVAAGHADAPMGR